MPEPPPKRLKTGNAPKLTPDDIRNALRSEDVIPALTELRNQFAVWPNDGPISTHDARLILAQKWLDAAPAAQDLFAVWENSNARQPAIIVLIVSILSSLLMLLSSHYTFHAAGHPILRALLTPPWMRKLNSYLGGSHTELSLVTLKLFNSMSAFGGGRERKSLLETFAWETKSLPKLLSMRRKTKGSDSSDPLTKPDIRTLYILFCLSFVEQDTPSQLKIMFLEQHKDVFYSIFRGLAQDPFPVIRRVLEICWAGIWSDPKIKRTLKIRLFSEPTVAQLLKIYERSNAEDDVPEHVPADLVHHFLLAICTRPGIGICFKDRGWYPRKSEIDNIQDDDDLRSGDKGGKIYNKILANILKTLKVNEDLRQQELALKIMAACPELVASFWSAAALTLEPRLSSKWIANISFFGSVLSMPIPMQSFLSESGVLYHPTPPPLAVVLGNTLPSVNTKAHFSKGLLQSSGLVQHCTALALCKCLVKYSLVLQVFRSIEAALEEDEADGQWAKLRRDLEREGRHRVPEFQVIVAFASAQGKAGSHSVKAALLAESAQRLLWMYHSCLPVLVAESRFDVGKLVQSLTEFDRTLSDPGGDRDAAVRLNIVQQLHVLRLLRESDQFVWSGKTVSSAKSHLHVLLHAFSACEIPALQKTLRGLIVHLLSNSVVFQNNQAEASLWVWALLLARHSSNNTQDLPEGLSLVDEAATVISFVDDCLQRCLKAPYRYIEDMQALYRPEAPKSEFDGLPGPLIMTVLEQLPANKRISPSDAFALVTFVRKLVLRLSGIQRDLSFLHRIAAKIDDIFHPDALFNHSPLTSQAIRREVRIMRNYLPPTHASPSLNSKIGSSQLEGFLRRIEGAPLPSDKTSRISAAFNVVDWVRLVGTNSLSDIRTAVSIVTLLHPPTLRDLADSIDPDQKLVWDSFNVAQDISVRSHLAFDCLFVNSTVADINDGSRREILANAAFATAPTLADIVRVICLICHSLHSSEIPESTRGTVLLLASVCQRAAPLLSSADFTTLKEEIFIRSSNLVNLCMNTDVSDLVVQGMYTLLEVVLDPTKGEDREIVSDITSHWLNVLMNSGSCPHSVVEPWIRYMPAQDLIGLLHLLGKEKNANRHLLETVIVALESAVRTQSVADIHTHLKSFTELWSSFPKSLTLESMIATLVDACLPVALSGRPLKHADISTSSILIQCDTAWSHRFHFGLTSLDLESIMYQEEPWSDSTIKILTALLYRSGCDSNIFCSWLATDLASRRSTAHFLQVLHAYLDVSGCQSTGRPRMETTAWVPHLGRLIEPITDENTSSAVRADCASCICLILAQIPSALPDVVARLKEQITSLPRDTSPTPEALNLGTWLARRFGEAKSAVASLIHHSLQWCIGAFAEYDARVDTKDIVNELVVLVETAKTVTADLAQTLLSVIIQNRLLDVSAIALLSAALQAVPLKPLVVNRYLQSIVQHPLFFKACAVGAHQHPSRDPIINVLHIIFNLHPANTCQATHIQPLVRIYNGTCSTSDRKLLSIFQLFETQRKMSAASLLAQWSATPEVPSSNVLEAVQSLDANLVLRTCLRFPKWRALADQTAFAENSRDAQLYDPVFLMLLFAQAMAENIPESAFGWIELFRTNIVGLIIRSLSAKDQHLREVARSQLAALWAHLETADMQEQPHVVYVLNVLRNILPPPGTEPLRRLPSYTTLILAHALRGIFYPSSFIYPLTARFLLQRPTLDITDVPMLYGMLYSSTDNWKKERGWIIRFLADGMMSTDDWRVLKRRHTWELLAGLFQSSEHDLSLRNSILEVLANLTCNTQATTFLVLKASLLQWIEMQLVVSTAEAIPWLKILENILVIVDAQRMETSTGGEWRSVICRCMTLSLHGAMLSSKLEEITASAASTVLRLSSLPGPPLPALPELLDNCFKGVESIEVHLDIPRHLTTRSRASPSHPPQIGPDLYAADDRDSLLRWGRSIEDLWQASMTLPDKPLVWDALTRRLLIWRSVVGEDGSALGEWVRQNVREVLRESI